MAAGGQAFYSTPAFELFRRGLNVQTVQRFHGINAYRSVAELGPDHAQDLLNVMVPGWGGLSKFRLPVAMSTPTGFPNPFVSGPQSFFDFQQANGTRQIIANFGNTLWFFTWNADNATLAPAASPANQIGIGINEVGPWQMATANNILFMVNGALSFKWLGFGLENWGIIQAGQPNLNPSVAGNLTATQGGWSWRVAGKNSVTGHVGAASVPSATTGNVGPFAFSLTAPQFNPADAQIDTLVWYRTQDGGGNWYRVAEVVIATGAVTFNQATITSGGAGLLAYSITDNTPDAGLDLLTQAPLLNFPPISGGKYMVVGQSRVFIANLPGAPQDIIYSGYEQILTGRPEESFPQGNRLRLSIGAEAINGIGVMQAGVVAFSGTKRMYALRGQVEDISVQAPVQFSAYLEELPYDIGTLCAQSIVSTPYGILFWATDRTVQLLDQSFNLKNLSKNVYPLLRRATKGKESIASGAYFNWLERDWYALTLALDGSVTNNLLMFLSLDDDTGQMEWFLSSIQADYISTISAPDNQRKLVISQGGLLYNLPVSQDTAGGISDRSIIPATNGLLPAYWFGGYFGNSSPYTSAMWRKGLLSTDQGGFTATTFLANNVTRQVGNPVSLKVKGPKAASPGWSINERATRCAVKINFPQQDVAANVLELHVGSIATSYRLR